MKMTLYHGSDHLIKEPVFHGGKKHNDYGYGFYCTESLELAKEWAVSPQNDGFANQYEITSDGLKILELNKQYYFHSDRMQFRRGELYIMEILDKEMKADDTRIQRVVFK